MKQIFYNGKIYTGELPLVSAFSVEDGVFQIVGDDTTVLDTALPGDERIDLQGKFVCAGFNDSHMHIMNFGNSLVEIPLHEHTTSLEELIEASRQYLEEFLSAKGSIPGGWLLGRGWNQDYFTDVDRMPNRYDLDQITTELPVCVTRCCGHCLVVNSKALELCGITLDTPVPEGGSVGVEDGVLDGRFFDNAMPLIEEHIPHATKEELREYVRLACKKLNAYGVTSCQSDEYALYSPIPWKEINEVYRELEESGELSVRVYEQSNFDNIDSLREFVEAGNVTGVGSDMFQIGPLKMLGDGSLGAKTAFLSKPYADDPSTNGLPVFSQEEFDEMIGYAHEHDMQVAVHAIGDQCLDHVLSAVEKALKKKPKKDHRHGIVHCQITRPDQLKKIRELGMHVYAQTIFLDYDINIVESRVGKELADTSYSWKTLMQSGVNVSNGTDSPVEQPDALAGMQCAVTRKNLAGTCGPYLPEQAFTVKEALDSYTICSAINSFQEDVKGLIKAKYYADFVILGENPFETAPEKIKDIPVMATYLGGRKVYNA